MKIAWPVHYEIYYILTLSTLPNLAFGLSSRKSLACAGFEQQGLV